ncbi:MAG: type II toxin-antitoxin system RelE/ParE family toxin [Smithellaceae bacterium]|nr:type II toxin-antitoxin system RelE/ParE family toxin [Smithellaceae bacterium]
MFTIKYSKKALKIKIKMAGDISGKIDKELEAIAANPKSYAGDWKKLKGSSFWRLRVGAWRVICEIAKKELIICVLKIGARGDIYK